MKLKNKILVSGATGFVGTALFNREVFNTRFDVVPIRTPLDIKQELKHSAGDSALLNLAGKNFGARDVIWEANVMLPKNLVRAFFDSGGQKVIHLSSYAIYGDALSATGSIETDGCRSRSIYGITKCMGELAIDAEALNHPGVQLFTLRVPSLFGEQQKKGAIFQIIKKFREGKAIEIAGDGTQERVFLHIDDLNAVIEQMISGEVKPGKYNLSSNFSTNINDLVARLAFGRKYNVRYINTDSDQESFRLNDDRASVALGAYHPNTEKYLSASYDWVKQF